MAVNATNNAPAVAANGTMGSQAVAIMNQIDREGKYAITPSLFQPYIENGKDFVNLYNMRKDKWERVQIANGTASLRKDEWLLIDEMLTRLVQTELNIVGDLMAAGLQYTFDGLSASSMYYESMSGMDAAEIHMRPTQHVREDSLDFKSQTVPLPFVSKDFPLDIRQLRQSRKLGNPLDIAGLEAATRSVLVTTERIFAGSVTYQVAGAPLYGLNNFPDAYTKNNLSNWAAGATTPKTIVDEVIAMIEVMKHDGFNGPFWLLLPPNYSARMQEDYNTYAGKTIQQRLLEIEDLQRVRVCRFFDNSKVVLLNASSETIRVLNGMSPTTFQWDVMAGLGTTFRVASIMVPQIKKDYTGKTGIYQATTGG